MKREKGNRILTFVEVFFFPRRPLYFNARYYRFLEESEPWPERLTGNRVPVHRNPFSTRFNKYWRSRIEICMDGEIGKIFLLVKEPDKQRGPSYIAREMETQLWRGATTSTMFASGEYHPLPRRKTELLNLILSVRSTWTRSSSFLFDNRVTEIKLGSFRHLFIFRKQISLY